MKISPNRKPVLWKAAAVALACASIAHNAHADDGDINFAGFASLAYAKALDDDQGPINSITDEGEYRDFNVLGLRMDADLKDNVSFTAQMVADGAQNYNPEFDWIFVNIGLTSELRLEIGKTRIPLYMYSDFVDVGYAYQWIEPPSAVYSESLLKTLEGLKLAYTTNIGDWNSELLVFGGADEGEVADGTGGEVSVKLDNIAGTAWTMNYEWLTLRAVYLQSYLTLDTPPAFNGLVQGIVDMGNGINQILPFVDQVLLPVKTDSVVDMFVADRDKMEYYGLGASLDFGDYFAVLELKDSAVGDSFAANKINAGYLTAGVRLPASVTLSANYGRSRQTANEDIYAAYISKMEKYIDMTSAVPSVQAAADAFDVAIPALGAGLENTINIIQHKTINEYSLQLRWDFHSSAAFKFEYLVQDNHQYSSDTFKREKVHPDAVMIGVDLVF